jgi:hypothetical protein
MAGEVGQFWDGFLGGPKTSTTIVTDKPNTNWGLIAAGIILAVGAILAMVWIFGGFKKKKAVQ